MFVVDDDCAKLQTQNTITAPIVCNKLLMFSDSSRQFRQLAVYIGYSFAIRQSVKLGSSEAWGTD
jgi:hypothetical protein